MRDVRQATEARRGECGHSSNCQLLSDFAVKPGVSHPAPGWGHNSVLMLTVSSQFPESSIFCVLPGFKICFCFAPYLRSSPGASPAVFLPRAICKLPTVMEHPCSTPRRGRAGRRLRSSLSLKEAAWDKAPLQEISCK